MSNKEQKKQEEKQMPATTGGGAVAAFDYGTDAGQGFENTTGADLAIPFIQILQSNSPQVENNNPEGSKPGMLFNSVTAELTPGDKGIVFIPCHREDAYVEWVPRDNGGGLVGRHDPKSQLVLDAIAGAGKTFGKLKTPTGNDLVETHYVYGLVLNQDGTEVEAFAVVSCSSTKIKPFRNWFTAMYMIKGKPPLFAHRTVIKTVKQTNKKSQSFYNFEFKPLKGDIAGSMINPVTESKLLVAARDFREMVVSGKAKAAFETQTAEASAEVDTDVDPEGTGNAPF